MSGNSKRPEGDFKYWAFISYSHKDEKWGRWLQRALEAYRVPRRLVGTSPGDTAIPNRLYPVFRDREELPTSPDLGQNIREALDRSRTLVVICSPDSARSRWVHEEIAHFKRRTGEARALCLIVAGEPNASDKPGCRDPECFPPALRFKLGADGAFSEERTEPIAADAREGKDGKLNAKLKIVAGILGVGFNDLKRRDEVRRRRLWTAAGVAATALFAVISGLGAFSFSQWKVAEQERAVATRRLSEARIQTSRLELQAGRAIPALGEAFGALDAHPSLGSALAVWETAGFLPSGERILFAGAPIDSAVATLNDGRLAVSTGDEMVLVGPHGAEDRWPHPLRFVTSLVVDPASGCLYALGIDGAVLGWRVGDREPVAQISGAPGPTSSMGYAAASRRLSVVRSAPGRAA
ncbi:MAG: toll/interleukin-1 receptor domain-containing protein, partial [Deferrisomatales bacterium]